MSAGDRAGGVLICGLRLLGGQMGSGHPVILVEIFRCPVSQMADSAGQCSLSSVSHVCGPGNNE